MDPKRAQYLIVLVSFTFFAVIVLLMALIVYLRKKRVQFIVENEIAKAKYEEQLQEAKIEITNQNLKNISWELHDNIGQLLSVAAIETKMLMQEKTIDTSRLGEVVDILGKSIAQIRGLSKTLNFEVIQKMGFNEVLENEIDRLQRLGLIKTELRIDRDVKVQKSQEIIIFRMLQEFISNSLKHAQATTLRISITFENKKVIVKASDDGIGFDIKSVKVNNGLLNLESRSKLINADFSLESTEGNGTIMLIILDEKSNRHEKI
jgi:signal transduction histidine kinase